MEKNNSKMIAVAALVVAVIGLSVGFAAFAATLTIENISATMTADNQFTANVNYKSTAPTCTVTGSSTAISGSYNAGTATGKLWSGISVPLTMTQKSITCVAEIENTSAYRAALDSITIGGTFTCQSVAASGTDGYATNASTICAGTKVTVNTSGATAEFTNASHAGLTGITGSSIASSGSATVTVTIEYTGTVAADGDVAITIPTISMNYKSAAAE